jgi:hypothetical protein
LTDLVDWTCFFGCEGWWCYQGQMFRQACAEEHTGSYSILRYGQWATLPLLPSRGKRGESHSYVVGSDLFSNKSQVPPHRMQPSMLG